MAPSRKKIDLNGLRRILQICRNDQPSRLMQVLDELGGQIEKIFIVRPRRQEAKRENVKSEFNQRASEYILNGVNLLIH